MARNLLKTTIFVFFLVCVCGCKNKSLSGSIQDDDLPTLNLTENALWDKPVMNEGDMQDFTEMITADLGEPYQSFRQKSNSGGVTLEEKQQMYATLASSKSVYAGCARLRILNNIIVSSPAEKFTIDFITESLNQAFEIAQGENPVSQSLFLNFWENCMVGYSNLGAYDIIFKESQRLLEICNNQNIPMGLMFSYKALAGNLQDHSDYSTAIMVYEKAGEIAKKMFPKLISSDWATAQAIQQNIDKSDYVLCYIDILSSQLYCCMMSDDYDWIKKNEALLSQIIEGTQNNLSVQLFMLYNMARYYDATGNDALFHKYMNKASEYKPVTDPEKAAYVDFEAISWCNYTIALHELKQNNPLKALEHMDKISKDWLSYQDREIYADIYSRLGRHKEAYEQLLLVVKHDKKDLNGRNRATLSSMSSMIEEKKKDIQMMQMKIDQQHVRLVYNGIIIALTFILIIVLGYFLYRQKKLIRKLAVALKQAEAANEAKSIFLKNMTHEINTPINHIYGFAQLMSDRSLPFNEEEMRDMCDHICESSAHLTKIAKNIVEVADKVSELGELETTESVLK